MYDETRLSALGTVRQLLALDEGARQLTARERRVLDHVLQLGLTSADFFAVRKLCSLASKPSWELLCLLLCERLACGEGSTYLSLDSRRLTPRLVMLGLDPDELEHLVSCLPALMEEKALFANEPETRTAPFVVVSEVDGLYRHKYRIAERNLATTIAELLQREWLDFPNLDEVFARVTVAEPLGTKPWSAQDMSPASITLAPEQKRGLLLAVRAPFAIVTGGPGTGKTSVVVTLLRMLVRLGVAAETIALAAPTGRAANRMGEALRDGLATVAPNETDASLGADRIEPKTLHRLLRWSNGRRRFLVDRDQPLDASWLIVDEASMIDLSLMEQLLNALNRDTRLVLLGDENQLPSVEAGAVFRDLTRLQGAKLNTPEDVQANIDGRDQAGPGSLNRHIVRLDHSFRQKKDSGGRHILAVANLIHEGRSEALLSGPNALTSAGSMAEIPWQGVCLARPGDIHIVDLVSCIHKRFYGEYQALCDRVFSSLEEESDLAILNRIFDLFDRVRVLCLVHKTLYGVEMINRLFRERFYRRDFSFLPGYPWMITQNDYRLGLFNGDIGIGLNFIGEDGKRVRCLVFRDGRGFKRITFKNAGNPALAFGMTVHKSQGSEMDHVVLILPERKNVLCKREVIYTAITRAKKSVLIYGKSAVLENAVSDAMDRASGLGLLLDE